MDPHIEARFIKRRIRRTVYAAYLEGKDTETIVDLVLLRHNVDLTPALVNAIIDHANEALL